MHSICLFLLTCSILRAHQLSKPPAHLTPGLPPAQQFAQIAATLAAMPQSMLGMVRGTLAGIQKSYVYTCMFACASVCLRLCAFDCVIVCLCAVHRFVRLCVPVCVCWWRYPLSRKYLIFIMFFLCLSNQAAIGDETRAKQVANTLNQVGAATGIPGSLLGGIASRETHVAEKGVISSSGWSPQKGNAGYGMMQVDNKAHVCAFFLSLTRTHATHIRTHIHTHLTTNTPGHPIFTPVNRS